jgi:outer membrane protein OmpA-like peptidoglycan-associated protein
MSHAFRFALNATIFWVVASTFWYSCLLKQVCLPDPPADGAGFSLFPSEVAPRPAQPASTGTTAPPNPAARFDGPLGFAWNSAEPVRGQKFDAFRTEVIRGDGPDRMLEIIGTFYPGERGAGDLGLIRAQRASALFRESVPPDRIKLLSRQADRASAEQRQALFEAVTVRWSAPVADRTVRAKPAQTAAVAAAATAAITPADDGIIQTKVLVYFASGAGTQSIDPDTLGKLRKLAEDAARASQLVVITGHTDDRGDEAGNFALGQARAMMVRDYLAATVSPPPRMRVVSQGPRQPIASNETEEGRGKNRRVEVAVE